MPLPASDYVGRFAPSPTGPLHFGSLIAALAGFLDAKSHQGKWLLRIEDIDPPREQPGVTAVILRSLEAHHLFWDGEVLYQSTRNEAYRHALDFLAKQNLTYHCTCSRQDLLNETIYNGHCRHLNHSKESFSATRLDTARALGQIHARSVIQFNDLIQGAQQEDVFSPASDFVIHRKDGLFAYQLAVVVDDSFQRISHVIRGTDLLESTARQILLFQLLDASIPVFGHLPLVVNKEGQKLSKQNLAPPLDDNKTGPNLFAALLFLQQNPPPLLQHETPAVILDWAIRHWQIQALTGRNAANPLIAHEGP